jgi:putative FmdB family regulatory protein
MAPLAAERAGRVPGVSTAMPTYDYRCEKCRKSFSIVQTVKEHERRKVVCPKCGSRTVKRQISPFYAITSRKS